MASFVYNEAKRAFIEGEIDLGADDIRVMLVMSNTTADTEDDANFITDFTTLDEYDGSAYVRKALANEAVSEDVTNNRAEFTADNVTWTALGAGTRQAQALVLYKHVTTDADSIPIAYLDGTGFPFSGNGGDVTVTWNAEGILQAG